MGVCLARAACSSVILTDGDSETLENCIKNLSVNGIEFSYHPSRKELPVVPGQVRSAE